jgi:hypothetical protein
MDPNITKNSSRVIFSYLTMNNKYCQDLAFIVKAQNLIKKTVSLLCVKTNSRAHKQQT